MMISVTAGGSFLGPSPPSTSYVTITNLLPRNLSLYLDDREIEGYCFDR